MNKYLKIIKHLLSEGYDNTQIHVEPEDPHTSYWAVLGIENDRPCEEGIYVYNYNDRNGVTMFNEEYPDGIFIGKMAD